MSKEFIRLTPWKRIGSGRILACGTAKSGERVYEICRERDNTVHYCLADEVDNSAELKPKEKTFVGDN